MPTQSLATITRLTFVLFGSILLCAIGCSSASETGTAPPEQTEVAIESDRAARETPVPETAAADSDTEGDEALLTAISVAELHERITSSDVPVVVDIWSTSCVPCMQEFPELVRVRNEYDRDALRCISFCVDYIGLKNKAPETYRADAAAFLRSVDAGQVENYLSTTPDAEVFEEFEIPSLPAVLVFEPGGKLQKKFIDADETAGFGYATHIEPLLAEMVAK